MLDYLLTCTHIYRNTVHCSVRGTGSRSGPGLNVCWLIKDGLRPGHKAQLPPLHFREWRRLPPAMQESEDLSEISRTKYIS